MQPDKIIVALLSILGIIFTYWFFMMKKEEIVDVKNSVDITVKGGYSPSIISIEKGKKTTINFIREDEDPCLEEVVLPNYNIKKFLPLGKRISVEIKPEKPGEYEISCGMNMFHGKIIVSK